MTCVTCPHNQNRSVCKRLQGSKEDVVKFITLTEMTEVVKIDNIVIVSGVPDSNDQTEVGAVGAACVRVNQVFTAN